MTLLLNVTELCGDAVVLGGVHRVEIRDGALTIRGVSLDRAKAILATLATDSLAVAKLGDVLPPALPPVRAEVRETTEPQSPAARPVPVAAPLAPAPPAPVIETPPWEAPVAPVVSAAPPAAATPTPDPVPSPGAPVETPTEPPPIPPEVRAAKTLRPVLIWLCEQADAIGKAVTTDTMVTAVQRLQPHLDAGLRSIAEPELRERVERALTGIGRIATAK